MNILKQLLPQKSKSSSVMQDWLTEEGLSWKQQTVLLSAIRGCDGKSKEDPSKYVSKFMRSLVLNNAATENTKFMRVNMGMITKFIEDVDQYPIHFVTHQMHAYEIVGYFHPDESVRKVCFGVYECMVRALHLNIESKKENRIRLADGKESNDLSEQIEHLRTIYVVGEESEEIEETPVEDEHPTTTKRDMFDGY